MSIPRAPNSLAPVAMASVRSAVATGPQATMDMGPSRPSTKAGMSILLAGAIIGGLIGAVIHARQNAADAAFASQQMHEAVALPAPSAPPVTSGGGVILAPETKDPARRDALADKHDDKTSGGDRAAEKEAKKKGGQKKFWTAPKSPKVTEATGDDEAPAPKAKKGKKDEDDGWTVASAGDDAPASKKADKPAKEEKASSKKAEPKADKPSSKKGGDDAVNVLKAAMGATENTL